jgi:redox-sensitive bicupin YhaK (pirin superfamily)
MDSDSTALPVDEGQGIVEAVVVTRALVEGEGKRVRLIAGSLYGARSPVRTLSEMFCADTALAPGAVLPLSSIPLPETGPAVVRYP